MGSGNLPKLMYMCIRQGTCNHRAGHGRANTTPILYTILRVHIIGDNHSQYNRTLAIHLNSRDVSRAAYHVRKFAKIVSLSSVTAIGFKGQRNNNRGGGRRPGFEASNTR